MTLLKRIGIRAIYLLVLLFLTICLYLLVFDQKLELQGDNAVYYILGKALAQGKGYVYLNSIDLQPANKYPPGYPALIALSMALFSEDIPLIKLVNGLFLALSILLLFHLFKALSDNTPLSFIAAIFALFNGHILRQSTVIMSEIPYLFFATLTLIFFVRIDLCANLKTTLKSPYFYLFLACLAFSFYVRSAGISLLAGVGLAVALAKNWRLLLTIGTAYTLGLAPWFIRGKLLGGNSYLQELLLVNPYRPELGSLGPGDFFLRLFANAKRYLLVEIPNGCFTSLKLQAAFADTAGFFHFLIAFALLALIALGAYRLKKHRALISGYLLGTMAILLAWPEVWTGARFILPLVPLLIFCFFNGLNEVLAWEPRSDRRRKVFHPFLYLPFLLLTLPGVYDQLIMSDYSSYPDNWANYFETARWVAKHTDENAVVSCRKPALFHVFSNRYTTGYRFTADDEEFLDDLKRRRADYIVLDALGYSSTKLYQWPVIERNIDHFDVALKLEEPLTYLFKFLPAPD